MNYHKKHCKCYFCFDLRSHKFNFSVSFIATKLNLTTDAIRRRIRILKLKPSRIERPSAFIAAKMFFSKCDFDKIENFNSERKGENEKNLSKKEDKPNLLWGEMLWKNFKKEHRLANKLKEVLDLYVKEQSGMKDHWAEGDEIVKKCLWKNLHQCELKGRKALELYRKARKK